MRRLIGPVSWAACVLLLFRSSPAGAQAVDLRLRDDSTRKPITGAIVRLIAGSSVAAQGLTNELGRIVLRALGPGTYRIKIDRIGLSGLLTEPFGLGAGENLRREVAMVSRPMQLPALEVQSKSECGSRGAEGTLAAALWEEIRKALTANLITGREGVVPLHVREFVREVGTNRRALRQWFVSARVVRGQPFTSLPPDALARRGFVEESGDTAEYAAPDAALLLSDQFVATHCFRATPGPERLVGLAFEPTPSRKMPEVRGTLWVDRNTSELQFLEYSYTGLEESLKRADLGGRVEFHRLLNGAWIVSYWHIRMPSLELGTVRGVGNTKQDIARLVGYTDRGGRAEVKTDSLRIVDRAVVKGRVIDSTTGGGLAGATVRVRGYPDSVRTDMEGRFLLEVSASGDQVVTASHPKLGLLRNVPSRVVLLSIGDTTVVEFAVQPLAAFVRALCGSPRERSGLVGIAWKPDGTPAENLEVRVRWRTADGVGEERSRIGPNGVYALCDLPAGPTLPVRVEDGSVVLFEQRVRLDWREYRWVELRAPSQPASRPQ